MPKWEIGKTYKTVGGLDAKLIYRTNRKDHPLVFVITTRNGSQYIAERDEQGQMFKDKIYGFNVVPPEPDKTSKFVNVCDGSVWGNYPTYDDAIRHYYSSKRRIGILEIQFEDGEYSGTVFHPVNKGEDK